MDILDNLTTSELNSYKLLDLVENRVPTKGRYKYVSDISNYYTSNLFQYILDDCPTANEEPRVVKLLDLSIMDIAEMFDIDKQLIVAILEYLMYNIPFDNRVKDLEDILNDLRSRIDFEDIYNNVIIDMITGESVKYVINVEEAFIWLEELIRLFLTKLITYIDNSNLRFVYCGLSSRDTIGLVLFDLVSL